MEMIKRKERESMAMTYKKLTEIIERNGVPEDVHLMSNSGWECSATEMDGVYWNPEANEVHFIQESDYTTGEEYTIEDRGSKRGEHRKGWVILK